MVSLVNSPVRLGASPAAASTPMGVFNQWFEALFPLPGALGCLVCYRVHQLLPHWSAAASPAPIHNLLPCWVRQPLPFNGSSLPGCPSPPPLPGWMKVSCLSPWLLDFLTVRITLSSGCFFVFKLFCPFGCARRHSMSTYASILAGSLK